MWTTLQYRAAIDDITGNKTASMRQYELSDEEHPSPVLHPRHKYFKTAGWEDEWVDAAEAIGKEKCVFIIYSVGCIYINSFITRLSVYSITCFHSHHQRPQNLKMNLRVTLALTPSKS